MDNSEPKQPKNTTFIPLAREIPLYRQAKLSGKLYSGPIQNILSRVSDIHANGPILSTTQYQPIKGHLTVNPITPPIMPIEPQTNPSTNLTPTTTPPSPLNHVANDTDTILQNQSSILLKKLKEKEGELAQLREKSQTQQLHLKDLTTRSKTADTIIHNLKQQLTNLKGQGISEQDVNNMQDKIAQKEKETSELQQEISQLKKTLEAESQLENQIVNYQQQIRTLTDQQHKLQSIVQEGERKLQALNQKLIDEKQQKESKETKIRELEKMLDDAIKTSLSPPASNKQVIDAITKQNPTLPSLTKSTNAISGVVTDKDNKFIVEAVVLIKNIAGQNLRALKTNQLGQFIATTPLPNGKYYIEISKPGLNFDILEITLSGAIVPPIEIKSYESTS